MDYAIFSDDIRPSTSTALRRTRNQLRFFPLHFVEGGEMSRVSNVVWSLIGLVVAIIGILGAVYGPDLYRGGKDLVAPIMEISRAEDTLSELNDELPFTPPDGGLVPENRFTVFLEIRRALLPRYQEWQHMERDLEKGTQEDWSTAMDVLAAVQEVMSLQVETLRTHGMSPAEFVWIEDQIYNTWLPHVADAVRAVAARDALREATTEDLEILAELERQHGTSAASLSFGNHLRQRLAEIGESNAPEVEGIAAEASELFWAHRQELDDLDLGSYSELHTFIRGGDNVEINIDPS
jgi:hypothetical protein